MRREEPGESSASPAHFNASRGRSLKRESDERGETGRRGVRGRGHETEGRGGVSLSDTIHETRSAYMVRQSRNVKGVI